MIETLKYVGLMMLAGMAGGLAAAGLFVVLTEPPHAIARFFQASQRHLGDELERLGSE